MRLLFSVCGQSIGVSASASVLPMNVQDWFPSGLTGWISLQSKWLSRVFSSTTIKSINSSVLSIFYGPISHMYMTTGKTLALTMQTFVGFHILTYEYSSRNFWLNIGDFLHDQMNHLPIKRISFHFPYKFVCVCVCVCVYMHIYLLLMLLHQLELTAWYKKWLKEFLFNFLKVFF